jgi:hypothetical protein
MIVIGVPLDFETSMKIHHEEHEGHEGYFGGAPTLRTLRSLRLNNFVFFDLLRAR